MDDKIPYGVDPALLTRIQREKRLEQADNEKAKEAALRTQIAQEKLKAETRIKANDAARQRIFKDLVSAGQDPIAAMRVAGHAVPFSNVKDQMAVEAAFSKSQIPPKPPEHYGTTTITNDGGERIFGQTNSAGQFTPIAAPRMPAQKTTELITKIDSDGSPILKSVATPLSTNLLNTLPENLRTNEFNRASMAANSTGTEPAAPRTSVGFMPMPQSVRDIPETQQAAPVAASQPVVAAEPAVSPRQFRDGSGTVWKYVGSATDPTKDRDPNSWQPTQ